MKTYTTKIAKNGATLYYSTETGKRIAKETALENERNYILTNGTVKERYELAKENFRFNERGEVERLWFHDVVSYGNRYNFKVATKYEWYVVSDKDADYALQKYCRMTLAEFRAEVEVETEENVEVEETTTEQVAEVSTMNAVEKLAEIKAEQDKINDAQVYYYTTNRGNVYTARYGETGSTPRSKWYTCHEIAGLSEQNVISLATETESGEFVNMLCKFIAAETDGSEDDADTNEAFSLLPDIDSLRDVEPTVEELLPELGELKTEIDATNDKYLLAGIGLLICSHFDLNEARKVFGLILSECRAEAEATVDDVKKLYNVCAQINFDKTFEHLPEFEYVRDGIKEETLDKAHDIFRAIRYNLGDQALASELTKLADEFGIDRALLLQSEDCRFNPALFDEKTAEPAPEPTGRMKWAAELLDNYYTYEFEDDWEAGNGGLARHYKRFNRNDEECGKLVEVFTDKTNFILDHVNIVNKSIRTYYYINGEQLSYLNGEFNFLWSYKYKAGMTVVGGEHLQVEVPDGQWKKYKNFMVNNDEFFKIMSERGACTIGETEPPEIPATVAPAEPLVESFTARRDRLLAERDAADAKLKEAEEAFKAARLAAFNADDAVMDFMEDAADEMRERIDLPTAEIEIKTMEGNLAYINAESVYVDCDNLKFTLRGDCSELNGLTLGIYDTPEQVMTAVEKFKTAIERGDKRFDFANPGQNFDKHAMRDSLERAMKIALERHEGFVKLGQMTAAENEMKLYAICRNALAALK